MQSSVQVGKTIPVIFRNLKGYDVHFIMQGVNIIARDSQYDIHLIPTYMKFRRIKEQVYVGHHAVVFITYISHFII